MFINPMRVAIRRNSNYLAGLGLGLFMSAQTLLWMLWHLLLLPLAISLLAWLIAPFRLVYAFVATLLGVLMASGKLALYGLFGHVVLVSREEFAERQRDAERKMIEALKARGSSTQG